MKRTHWVLVAVALLVLAGVLFWAFRPQPVRVEVAEVRTALFENVVEEDGKTRVRERYVVSAPLAGRLARVQLKAGDVVQAGTVVAVLWPSAPAMIDARSHRELNERVGAAEAAVDQARANIAREEAALEKARIDLARQKKLQGEGFLSPSALDQAELAVRVQAKSLEAARFAREGAAHDLAQARAALMRAQEGAAVKRPEAAWPITSPVMGACCGCCRRARPRWPSARRSWKWPTPTTSRSWWMCCRPRPRGLPRVHRFGSTQAQAYWCRAVYAA